MSIGDKLRRAAGLFVEMPPAPERTASADETRPASSTTNEDDIDRRLAAMDQTMHTLRHGGDAAPRTVEQIVQSSHGPNLDEIHVGVGAVVGDDALGTDGRVDFAGLYQTANLPAAPFTAEQTIEMISSLPQSLPLEMKRQTMQVTLASLGKAIGATPESIVADTSRKLAALASFSENHARHTDEFVEGAEADIAFLLSQVEEKRTAILAARQMQADIHKQCAAEADRLDDILEFFSLNLPPSRHAAPGSGA